MFGVPGMFAVPGAAEGGAAARTSAHGASWFRIADSAPCRSSIAARIAEG